MAICVKEVHVLRTMASSLVNNMDIRAYFFIFSLIAYPLKQYAYNIKKE